MIKFEYGPAGPPGQFAIDMTNDVGDRHGVVVAVPKDEEQARELFTEIARAAFGLGTHEQAVKFGDGNIR